MWFVLPPLIVMGAAVLTVWWLFFRAAVRHERTVREARRREVEFERLLATPNEPLYCVSCQEVFRGPLDELGCPRCLLRAFVIPARASKDARVIERARRLTVPASPGEESVEPSSHTRIPSPERPVPEETIPQGNKRT